MSSRIGKTLRELISFIHTQPRQKLSFFWAICRVYELYLPVVGVYNGVDDPTLCKILYKIDKQSISTFFKFNQDVKNNESDFITIRTQPCSFRCESDAKHQTGEQY